MRAFFLFKVHIMTTQVLSQPVLLLNKNYQALRTVSVKRALTMLVNGAAEALLEDYSNYDFDSWLELSQYKEDFDKSYSFVRSVSFQLAAPQVIRLLNFDKMRKRALKLNRRSIYERDNYSCQYCGKKSNSKNSDQFSLDHVLPSSRGGKNTWTNLVCCCVKCNVKKDNKLPKEAGMKLLKDPVKPNYDLSLPRAKFKSWAAFVSDAYWNVELQ